MGKFCILIGVAHGLQRADEEMGNLTTKLNLDVQQKSLKQSMKDAITYHPIIFNEFFLYIIAFNGFVPIQMMHQGLNK
jgi:hypothetical protein